MNRLFNNNISSTPPSLEPSPPPEEDLQQQHQHQHQQYLPQDQDGNSTNIIMNGNGGHRKGGALEHDIHHEQLSSRQPQHHPQHEHDDDKTIHQHQPQPQHQNGGTINKLSITLPLPTPSNDMSSSTYADAVMNGIHDPMTNLAVHSPHDAHQQQQLQLVGHLPQIQELNVQQQQPQQQQQQQQQPQYQYSDGSVPQNNTTSSISSSCNNNPSQQNVVQQYQTGGEATAEEEGQTSRMSMGSEVEHSRSSAMSIDTTCGNSEVMVAASSLAASLAGEGAVPVPASRFSNELGPQQNGHHPNGGDDRSIIPNSNNDVNGSSSVAAVGREATEAHERQQNHSSNGVGLQQPQQQQQQQQQQGSLTIASSSSQQKQQQQHYQSTVFAREYLRTAGHSLERLSYILGRGSLVMINFSQRNLNAQDAQLIHSAILSNPQLSVLKLGYNNLGNVGAKLIAEAIQNGGRSSGGGMSMSTNANANKSNSDNNARSEKQQQQISTTTTTTTHNHHPSLSVLDLGFNNIGDEGCTSLATMAVSHNPSLSTLYLSGNAVRESGALALAEVIATGTGLTSLHLTANRIGPRGVRGIMRSIAEFDVTMQMAHQDRENRLAVEELEKRKRRILKEEEKEQRMNENTTNSNNGGGIDNENEDVDLELLGINDDNDNDTAAENQQASDDTTNCNKQQQEEPDDLARLHGFKCMEELYLGGTNMESTGCLSVSNMLLTNLSLRVICLSDNSLNDQDLSLFSQSLSRNRELPLETLRLSFNKLTCVGVETLMNAIWGSKTLREIKLDNNQIRDRGAQLAAVVLTSVELEVLDMGFNRLTIVGIKALMKSLAENRSLLTLTLSGNVLDTNASKAVSYALAYNKTIRKLYVDHCSLSYAAQRHIAAGIVSNSNLALRVMSGFPLGAISVTLGLPGAMETWSNEQVLKFIRVMWDRYRHEKEAALALSKDSSQSMSTVGASEGGSVNAASGKSAEKVEPKSGPSDPATVVAAAKSAFEVLGDAGGALLLTEEPQRSISDSSPMVSSDAVMLEKTSSGTIRAPSFDESDEILSSRNNIRQDNSVPLEVCNTHISTGSLCTTNGKECPETPVDPAAKKRNMEWLRLHFRSLNEMIGLPYVYADLLQLYRYFYSPVDADDEGSVQDGMPPPHPGLGFNPGIMSSSPPPRLSGLQRKISYRGLHNVMMGQSNNLPSPNFSIEKSCKRRPVSDQSMQPATKRARNGKPRIDYFPRIKAKIEKFLSSSKQTKALVLLRQLKFVETTMFRGGNPYCDQQQSSTTGSSNSNGPVAADAEVILIDMH